MCYVVCLEARFILLVLGEELPYDEPVKDVQLLALALEGVLQQEIELLSVLLLLICTVGQHHVHGVVEGLCEALLVARGVQVPAQVRPGIPEPEGPEEAAPHSDKAAELVEAQSSSSPKGISAEGIMGPVTYGHR